MSRIKQVTDESQRVSCVTACWP